MTVNKKIRHHYIPQCLSRKFCLEGKLLFQYDSQKGKVSKSSPKDIFVRKKYHSVTKDGRHFDHNCIEDMFMRFESEGCRIISEIIKTKSLNFDANGKYWMSSFWSLMYLRVPVARDDAETSLLDTVHYSTKLRDKMGKLPSMPEELKKNAESISDLLDKGELRFSISLPQITMMPLIIIKNIADIIFKMNWCLLWSDESDYFLLSDNPVAIFDPDIEINNGYGFALRSVEVSFPIGKNHCLLASWKNTPAVKRASSKIIKNINERTALFGKQFYAHPLKSKKVFALINRYKEITPKTEWQHIPTQRGGKSGYISLSKSNILTNPDYKKLYLSIPPIISS